ncbi:DUF305 domain-containing protein [Paracoccus suum]|uniref:DUF305 domain-containing protein n=1 Tax=Paracoccus suum TaxID=2259340 RepID=A0A344PPK0_9RHOB|nr:DUF305 domain-containing protein [Paracoccus suum]
MGQDHAAPAAKSPAGHEHAAPDTSAHSAAPVAHGHVAAGHDTAAGAPEHEQPFLLENDEAMVRMMTDMTIKASGDIDRDFALMMIPHHQGAVDMAKAYLRHGGDDPVLQRLAQEIIVEQIQEIAAMQMAIGNPAPAPAPVPTQAAALRK